MNYTILNFNSSSGQLLVDTDVGVRFALDVPIEDSKFIAGETLRRFIEANLPTHYVSRLAALSTVANAEDLIAELSVSVYAPPEKTYAQLRAASYPSPAMYLDAVVKGEAAQAQAYIDQCLAVKALYPKPVPVLVSPEVLLERQAL